MLLDVLESYSTWNERSLYAHSPHLAHANTAKHTAPIAAMRYTIVERGPFQKSRELQGKSKKACCCEVSRFLHPGGYPATKPQTSCGFHSTSQQIMPQGSFQNWGAGTPIRGSFSNKMLWGFPEEGCQGKASAKGAFTYTCRDLLGYREPPSSDFGDPTSKASGRGPGL